MKRVGLLGGTFNPIHLGHLAMAQVALERLKLDEVIFVVSNLPPHKTVKNAAPANDRYEMVKLATSDNPAFKVSDVEISRGGKSFSIDTVKYFRKILSKQTKLYFIIGGDSAGSLHGWRGIDELLKMVTFVAVNRPGFKASNRKIKLQSITMPALEISSSYLRSCFQSGLSAKYLIRDSVFNYIKKKKLYSLK